MVTRDYNKQYVELRKIIRKLRSELILSTLNETTLNLIENLDKIGKELDLRYSDSQTLDHIESDVNSFRDNIYA